MGKRSTRRRQGDVRLRVLPGGGATKRGTSRPDDAMQPLIQELRRALRHDDPWALLAYVSTMVEVADGRMGPTGVPTELGSLVESFIGVDLAETTAVLTVLTALVDEPDVIEDIERELTHRTQPLPLWLKDLRETAVTAAQLMTVPGDSGQNVILGLRWSGGGGAAFVVYVDHARGTVIRDAFPAPLAIDDVVAQLRNASLEPGSPSDSIDFEPLDLADARALLEEALAATEPHHHDPESDTWPQGRPLLQWLLRTLPEGGAGWSVGNRRSSDGTEHELDLDDLIELGDIEDLGVRIVDAILQPHAELVEGFNRSEVAQLVGLDVLGNATDRAALALLCSDAAGRTRESLLDWTPSRVEDLLFGHLPRAFLLGDHLARRLPHVLRAFALWGLAQQGSSPREEVAVRDTVDRCAPEFIELVTSPEAVRLRVAVQDYAYVLGDPVGMLPVIDPPDPFDWTDFVLTHCSEEVGGRPALLALDADPLPDEPFDWSVVPDDIREPVAETLGWLDRLADERFDVEFRTACRRYLAAAVTGDPEIYRRRGSTTSAAAVIAWLVGRANGLIARGGDSLAAGDLWPFFGLKSPASSRGQAFRKAVGLEGYSYSYTDSLGRPEWLTGPTRAGLVRRRDEALAVPAEDGPPSTRGTRRRMR